MDLLRSGFESTPPESADAVDVPNTIDASVSPDGLLEVLSQREVANLLDLTVNATRIRVHRARQALGKLLSSELETDP